MIELKRTERERSFQILTPHAIAAARGTTWVVQVDSDGTHALVMLGYVEVTPRGARNGVLLRANQGADVPSGADRTTAKRWGTARVDALLARFGMRRSCFFRPSDC